MSPKSMYCALKVFLVLSAHRCRHPIVFYLCFCLMLPSLTNYLLLFLLPSSWHCTLLTMMWISLWPIHTIERNTFSICLWLLEPIFYLPSASLKWSCKLVDLEDLEVCRYVGSPGLESAACWWPYKKGRRGNGSQCLCCSQRFHKFKVSSI